MLNKKMLLRTLAAAVILPAINGCATFNNSLGDPEYSCKGMPDGVRCMSVTDVYDLTDGEDYKRRIEMAGGGATMPDQSANGVLVTPQCLDCDPSVSEATLRANVGRKYRDTSSNKSNDNLVPQTVQTSNVPFGQSVNIVRYPVEPRVRDVLPIRTKARVMRISFNPWESDDDYLSVPGFVYVEVEGRRWMLGNKASAQKNHFTPLESR